MEDSDAFGHWLSGFSAGEGTFCLHMLKRPDENSYSISCRFVIGLREDDGIILLKIQEYWKCGAISWIKPNSTSNPQFRFRVDTHRDNMSVVVPHFLRFPLRGRKARDFEIYKQGVAVIERVRSRPRPRGNRTWFKSDWDEFRALKKKLEKHRVFKESNW